MRGLFSLALASLALPASALRRQGDGQVQEGGWNPMMLFRRGASSEAAAQVPEVPLEAQDSGEVQVPPAAVVAERRANRKYPPLAVAVPEPWDESAAAAAPKPRVRNWLRRVATVFESGPNLPYLPRARERFATYQNHSEQRWTDGSKALPAFKNVLLVVHCRVRMQEVNFGGQNGMDWVVCKDREAIAKLYAPYFGDIFYMTQANHCKRGMADPTVCLAELMETRGAKRDGLFYMHFDALINPAAIARDFHKQQVYSFLAPWPCKLDRDFKMTDCRWGYWGKCAPAWMKAWEAYGHELIEDKYTVWNGMDDLFYIPKRGFKEYVRLARGFAEFGLHHEASGPTIRAYVTKYLNHGINDLECVGNCCRDLTAEIAFDPNFRCGHKFQLGDQKLSSAVSAVIKRSG